MKANNIKQPPLQTKKPTTCSDFDSALPETNMAPENQWLEDEFPFGKAYFQGLC